MAENDWKIWRDNFEQGHRELCEIVDRHSKELEAVTGKIDGLTLINREQVQTLRKQDDTLLQIHDALLGTMDGKKTGLVQDMKSQGKWQRNCSRAFWILVTPLLGAAGIAAVVGVAHIIAKGLQQ